MPFHIHPVGRFSRTIRHTIWMGCLGGVIFASALNADTKKLDKESIDMAEALAKDREAAFSEEASMPIEAFREQWSSLAARLDSLYSGHEVELGKFGYDIKSRTVFAHLVYMGLRTQTRGTALSPATEELIARHPFLQELVVEGSCYTGGDPYPKKLTVLIKANPTMQVLLRGHLESWKEGYRKKFEKAFQKKAGSS